MSNIFCTFVEVLTNTTKVQRVGPSEIKLLGDGVFKKRKGTFSKKTAKKEKYQKKEI
jgi:hypothetical protein